MSGHSKWATTHRQKSAADAKKGAAFTKIANLIIIAAKQGGGDPESNFKLRLAIDKARAANMPKDNIERAIKRGTGEASDGKVFEEVTYELFGPEGSAFIVEGVTDNKNRTITEVKTVASKNGGQMAGPNAVAWMFDRLAFATVAADTLAGKDIDELELALIDAGANDISKDGDWEITAPTDKLQSILDTLKTNGIEAADSGLGYFPKDELKINSPEAQEKIERFYGLLDDIDDVNNVHTNASW